MRPDSPMPRAVSPLRDPFGDNYLSRNMLDEDDPPAYAHPEPVSPLSARNHGSRRIPPRPSTPRTSRASRLVIGVDFGTTFTGVAFATTDAHRANLSSIEVLQDWTPKMNNKEKVPSVISYSVAAQGEAQWGSDISENAVTMVNQKLELEIQDSRIDELDLTLYLLKGAGLLSFEHIREAGAVPEFPCKAPEDIVEDYMRRVFGCAYAAINGTQLERTRTPVDLVVTMPVSWSYQAQNSLYKALRRSGFSSELPRGEDLPKYLPTLDQIVLVSEPEAAAYFTARDLQERGTDFLQEDNCFVLCDAGGGTVDAVAYQVKKVKPFLELERVTKPTGRKCGSALIDTAFKGWLRDELGRPRYAALDPVNADQQRISTHTAESGAMRVLIRRFNVRKAVFSNLNHIPIKIDLPPPLNGLSIPGRVHQGELTIKWSEMKKLMDTCVNETIGLILDQTSQVRLTKGRRFKNVFLVGGFGASPYLREEIQESLELENKTLRRPDTEKILTAVVQGAVIYGIEKARLDGVTYMNAIANSYGIVGHKSRFEWLIKHGDLVLSNQATILESKSFWHNIQFNNWRQKFQVFSPNGKSDHDADDLPEDWQIGQHEVQAVGIVRVDFKAYLESPTRASGQITHASPSGADTSRTRTRMGPLQWRLKLVGTRIEAELLLKGSRIGELCQIQLDVQASSNGMVEETM